MTPQRFWIAMALFHVVVLAASACLVAAWRHQARCRRPAWAWLGRLVRDVARLALHACVVAFLAVTVANLGDLPRLLLGAIASRLMSQALFGEGMLFALALGVLHWRAGQAVRGAALGALALLLVAVSVDAYHVEPRMLRVRRHTIDRTGGDERARSVRILHATDIQAAVIGPHEERALRAGLACRPDLIVLTGDDVQDALGRPTERQAARDLRTLMTRIGFDAPLGVFATDGDVGPRCRDVFAGTRVRCLVDATAAIALPGGGTLAVTGLSTDRGRERDPAWLAWLMRHGPSADHRIVISHAPDFVDAMREPVDLVLAGHTHGGQVVLPFFGPPRTAMRLPRLYAGDVHDYRGTPLHVSRGVGMERGFSPPIRFLCPPEICLLDLRLPLPRHVRAPAPGA